MMKRPVEILDHGSITENLAIPDTLSPSPGPARSNISLLLDLQLPILTDLDHSAQLLGHCTFTYLRPCHSRS